jgi:rhodanese-related sulfurtransferase
MNTLSKTEITVVAKRTTRQACAIISLSFALGLVFNAANPLGIKRGSAMSTVSLGKNHVTVPDRISLSTNGVYQNEVLSLTLNEGLKPPQSGVAPSTPASQTITWEETKTLLASNSAVLVDARPAAAFAAGHIPGAVSLPILSTAAKLVEFRRLYDAHTPLIVYCASASCPVADHMAQRLINDSGYLSVRVFSGGYLEWQRSEGVQTANAQPLTAANRP